MAIREKVKLLFKSKSKSDRDSQTSGVSSKASDERWPSNVYKPGEPMPRPKYRAPPKKEHKDKLEAFSFAEAWRRKSFQSQYSPMGTRAPSRRNSIIKTPASRRSSWISLGRKSFSGRSTDGARSNSITSGTCDAEKGHVRHREGATMHMGVAVPTTLKTEPEADGDDDVANVGLSRVQSKEQRYQPLERPRTADSSTNGQTNGLTKTYSTAHDHQPFTEQDLALALHRSHLAVPVQA
ncbi:hypothetical protein CERZMDRAFT_89263 [Cercospora zeae-maydis SCOH1-5]|uniref:Uncharacterized protein n=1 Tax=Cercospora zeae-maydis SCOH1-5 TaxID=717836 RepID=A0A6A6EXT3_9PEZI|nr:hypothetical protein CERZMDRAFT_89263 [Cercospora zeae-maydis SCOH1-5]